jgi:hypothetical protein
LGLLVLTIRIVIHFTISLGEINFFIVISVTVIKLSNLFFEININSKLK